MVRRLSLASVVALLLIAACSGPRVIVSSPEPQGAVAPSPGPTEPGPEQLQQWGGLAVIAQPYIQYLFAPPEIVSGDAKAPPTGVRDSTLRLMGAVPSTPRLKLTALASTDGTAALAFQETTPFKSRWGAVMIPAEHKVFSAFAANPNLGNWLIVVDDVIVIGGKDPVPLTAYRWPRSAVDAYAGCGIPKTFVVDDCTHAFYSEAQTVFVIRSGTNVGQ